jgi:hypothetical protein
MYSVSNVQRNTGACLAVFLFMLVVTGRAAFASALTGMATSTTSTMVCTSATSCTSVNQQDSQSGTNESVSTFAGFADVSATWGALSVDASSPAGSFRSPCDGMAFVSPPFPSVSACEESDFSTAMFSDTIHMLGVAGVANFDLVVNANCCEIDQDGGANVTFSLGTASLNLGCIHCVVNDVVGQIPLSGSVSISGSVEASTSWTTYSLGDPSEYGYGRLTLGAIVFTDSSGNVIPAPPYYTDSGTAYFGEQSYVPEPASGMLLLGGLAIAALIRLAPGIRQRRPALFSPARPGSGGY